MIQLSQRSGLTLVEIILFLAILSIMAGAIIGVLLDTQDARVRQHSVASLEQQGTHVLSTTTKMIRRAEKIISPPVGDTGSILVLQMAKNEEYPTIVMHSGSGIILVQKSTTSALLNSEMFLSDMSFRNVGGTNIWMSFTLTTDIPTLAKQIFRRTFNGSATLFPDNNDDSGDCGTCPDPACVSGTYLWYVCESAVCTLSPTSLSC